MESIADFEKWIGIMRSELEQQAIAVKRLAVAFNEGDLQLSRHDQAARLRLLLLRTTKEVEDIKQMESAAQYRANNRALLSAGAKFIFGGLFMAATRHQDAFKVGAGGAASVLSKEVPFGTVYIVIGKKGIPEDMKVISVSRLARESTKTEPEVEAIWKHDGYLLVTPERFIELLDKATQVVLDGSLCLPIAVDELIERFV